MAARLTLLLIPPSKTNTASLIPKRRRSVRNKACKVVVSPRLPRKTSICSGIPWASVATAKITCGRSERWSRLWP